MTSFEKIIFKMDSELRDIVGKHSMLWNYSKSETVEKLYKYIKKHTHINDKPEKEAPYEHKWLHNKWRTEYLTQCALYTLCNPHEFEPKLDTKFKYHVCQKCGIVISDAEKKAEFYQCKSYYDNPTEPYKCPSYYDDNNQLQNCTCGKCGEREKVCDRCGGLGIKRKPQSDEWGECPFCRNNSQPKEEKVEPIKMPDITEYPFKSFDFDVKFQQWMLDVTNWINSQNKGE